MSPEDKSVQGNTVTFNHDSTKSNHVPDSSSQNLRWKFICLIIVISLILVASGLFFLLANHYENEVVSSLIPQPFTENNDFMYFHLSNKMKILLVRPNTGINDTYIC